MNTTETSPLLAAALAYHRAGLCVLPANLAQKRPATNPWKCYQQARPVEPQLERWFSSPGIDAVCLLAGHISGDLEMLDFDHGAALFEDWKALIDAALFERLLVERSQSGGRHVVYRVAADVPGNRKLAEWATTVEGPEPVDLAGKMVTPRLVGESWEAHSTMIETRGEGGIFLCAPSPGYVVEQGSFLDLPILTEDEHATLIAAAQKLSDVPVEQAAPPSPPAPPTGPPACDRPGDDYNMRGDLRGLLRQHGWTMVQGGANELWRRPGKPAGSGGSATYNGDVFFVHSSNAHPFQQGQGYSRFRTFALLEHGGDDSAAAAALRAQGYGGTAEAPGVDLTRLLASLLSKAAEAAVAEQPQAPAEPAEPEYSGPRPGCFPPHLLKVPGLIGDLVEHNLATAMKPQPALALGAALALLSTLTGRKIEDAYGTRTNLYCLGVCPSGGGKEHARKLNKEILFHAGLDAMIGPEGLASHAGLFSAVEKQPAILFQLDEIGRMLKTLSNPQQAPHLYNVATVLMKMFTSSNSVYFGDGYADVDKNKSIDQPHPVVYGTTVPQSLYEGLTAESLSDGFLSRMLIFETDDGDPAPHFVPRQELPAHLVEIAKFWGKLSNGGNLSKEHPKPLSIDWEAGAESCIVRSESAIRRERQGKSVAVAALWTRTTEKARKLALLYACSANPLKPVVDLSAAQWGIELSEYLTRRTLAATADWVSETKWEANLKRLRREIAAAGTKGLTKSQINRKSQRLPAKERQDLLNHLVELGDVALAKDEPDGKGRPAERYLAAIHAGDI